MIAADPPPIVGGSQDDLLEWSLRESGSGLASLNEGTARGVDRLQRGEVIAAAVHFHGQSLSANADERRQYRGGARDARPARCGAGRRGAARTGAAAGARQSEEPAEPGRCSRLRRADGGPAAGRRRADAARGAAGARRRHLKDLRRLEPPCLTGPDLAAAIRAGSADCGIATRAAAKSAGLDFVPLLWESFDLLMRQRSYFRALGAGADRLPRRQRLKQRAAELTGYDPSPAGQIRFAAWIRTPLTASGELIAKSRGRPCSERPAQGKAANAPSQGRTI